MITRFCNFLPQFLQQSIKVAISTLIIGLVIAFICYELDSEYQIIYPKAFVHVKIPS